GREVGGGGRDRPGLAWAGAATPAPRRGPDPGACAAESARHHGGESRSRRTGARSRRARRRHHRRPRQRAARRHAPAAVEVDAGKCRKKLGAEDRARRPDRDRQGHDRDQPGAVSRRDGEWVLAAPEVVVELAIDDPDLAQRVRALILERPEMHLADAEDDSAPDVRITDSAVGPMTDVPIVVIANRTEVLEALQAGA